MNAADKMMTIITLDGPAGTGKGTISRMLAKKLGWHYLESGALFRLLAYTACAHQLNLENGAAIAQLANTLNVQHVDDNDLIRTEAIGNAASKIAILPEVRTALTEKQREFYRPPGLVAEGRDMGTQIFPNALLKFFLDATPEERAQRRYAQLKKAGINASLPQVLEDLKQRDMRDRTRSISPLIPAPDAIVIDTTSLSVDEVFTKVLELSEHKLRALLQSTS